MERTVSSDHHCDRVRAWHDEETDSLRPLKSAWLVCNENHVLHSCRQLIQSAGFVRGNHVPPAAPGGHTKHFFRMANRNTSEPMTAMQVWRSSENRSCLLSKVDPVALLGLFRQATYRRSKTINYVVWPLCPSRSAEGAQ